MLMFNLKWAQRLNSLCLLKVIVLLLLCNLLKNISLFTFSYLKPTI